MIENSILYESGDQSVSGKEKKRNEEIDERFNTLTERMNDIDEKISARKNAFKQFLEHPILGIVITAALGILGFAAIRLMALSEDVREVTTRLETVSDQYNRIEEKEEANNEEIQDFKIEYVTLNADVKNLANEYQRLLNVDIEEKNAPTTRSSNDNEYQLDSPNWKDSDTIASDRNTGHEYKANELMNRKLLITYKENNKDNIFYGQFNENNRWDGECLLNIYDGEKLIAINESVYNNGDLLRYKQIMVDSIEGVDVWNVVEKTVIDSKNGIRYGDTWNYYKSEDYIKNFQLDNITDSDLLYFDSFRKTINKNIERFYHGNTSNGKYNDNTESAYLVKYTIQGTIKVLYKGKFEDGKFKDLSDDRTSWYITKDDETDYMYYNGKFNNNTACEEATEDNFKNPITIEEIQEIIKDMKFDCELNWDETSGKKNE